ncbi:hypothetical protein [Chitinophaga sp. sic0106]|uniref:hypothetical protein n=1 Tax=Chitinophaga sp. sic0106 TaxID=2854785 RepID=UPI001C4491B6|nr:hypothetical protein [Chitinophaga sp. sic0106]MBV7530483.1 hypothetical protein [Chitinophaga sp. sic0106]
MSTNLDINQEIPIGDLQLYDNYIPALAAGSHFIHVSQSLMDGSTPINSDPLETIQEFFVSAPQYSIDSSQVINRYPPNGTTGLYGEVLPHIVLKDPMLPWERDMQTKGAPWMALLVFQEEELADGDDATVKSTGTTIAAFRKQAANVLVPMPELEADVPDSSPCRYINMPIQVFQEHMPYLNELPYLAHVRKINTGNRVIMGLDEHGLFSVIASNKFAKAPTTDDVKTVKNIVHLVSLEGLHDYLNPNANFSGFSSISLITLDSWAFYSLPDLKQDFRALVLNLVAQETTTSNTIDPTLLWLKLPAINTGGGDAEQEVSKRIKDGYVPMAYHTRNGENTFAWYRGPLTPLLPKANPPASPYNSADAALIFDKSRGIFDVSLAAAWEIGRSAALGDTKFEQLLIDLRKNVSRKADQLYYRDTSPHFKSDETIQSNFLQLMTPERLHQIKAVADQAVVKRSYLAAPTKAPFSLENYQAVISTDDVQEQLDKFTDESNDPIADWVSQLMLLYKLPFDSLVPDERLLPDESLRFFYLDKNWLNAAVDGAMSLGLESSKSVYFNQQIRKRVLAKAKDRVGNIRAQLLRKPSMKTSTTPDIMSGFLLRSALVTGWPNLQIEARDDTSNSLKIIRMDHLAPNILLVIFDGVPINVAFSEPNESLGFGVDDDGKIVLRNISTSGTTGDQVDFLQIRDLTGAKKLFMRAAGSRVLDISPDSSQGLIQNIVTALKQKNINVPGNALTSATFAIQMIKSAEAIVFNSQAS